MNGAVVIEPWKLAVFERHLKAANFKFENKGGLMPGMILLEVEYELPRQQQLGQLCVAAFKECKRTGKPK